jgi:hypothetical protein
VTDRRLLVLGQGPSGKRTVSYYLNALPPPVIMEALDRSGSLAFGAFPTLGDSFAHNGRNGFRMWSSEPSATPVLRHIPEVRRVRDLIAQAQQAPNARSW